MKAEFSQSTIYPEAVLIEDKTPNVALLLCTTRKQDNIVSVSKLRGPAMNFYISHLETMKRVS